MSSLYPLDIVNTHLLEPTKIVFFALQRKKNIKNMEK